MPEGLTFEDLSPDEQAAIVEHYLSEPELLRVNIEVNGRNLHNLQSTVDVTVSDVERLQAASTLTNPEMDVGPKLLETLAATVDNVLQELVVARDQLSVLPRRGTGPQPAMELEIIVHDFGAGNTEARLSSPDPTMFRREASRGTSRESIARAISAVVKQGIASTLPSALSGG